MSEELKLCPFCGSEDARVFNCPDEHGGNSYGIQCSGSDCNICGPERGNELAAREAWNRRIPPAPSTANAVDENVAFLKWWKGKGYSGVGTARLAWHARAALAAKPAASKFVPFGDLMGPMLNAEANSAFEASARLCDGAGRAGLANAIRALKVTEGSSNPAPTGAAKGNTCGKCPKQTPYGPAICGKCMEAEEARKVDVEAEREAAIKWAEVYYRNVDEFDRDHMEVAIMAWLAARRTQAEGAKDA